MTTPLVYPGLISQPFARTGAKNTIPLTTASPLASFDDGFPPVTRQPISTGGVAPSGKDMNGILYDVTLFQAWANGGGRFGFDAGLAAAIGGYPTGAVLQLADGVSEVVNVLAGNTNDPNSVMTGWAPYAGADGGRGSYVADTGAVNAYVATVAPPVAAYKNGYNVIFKALHTNTGASTLNTGGGAVALHRSDGAALVAGDVVVGNIYEAVYDAATTSFWLVTTVVSQISAAGFSTQHLRTYGTGMDRDLAVTYTNTFGRPMYLEIYVAGGTSNNSISINVNGTTVASAGTPHPGYPFTCTAMVPPGATYSLSTMIGSNMQSWSETY